ncbi:MAG: hypothetical protein R2822_05610 [Spirosomataceae bacterium]
MKLLLVSDYEDRGFGPVNIRDEDIVRQMFSKIAHRLDYKFEVAYVNKTNARALLNRP